MATKTGIKYVNLEIPEELHYKIKLQAVKEKKLLKDFILEIINVFFKKDDYLIAESLDTDDLRDMEPGKNDIVK